MPGMGITFRRRCRIGFGILGRMRRRLLVRIRRRISNFESGIPNSAFDPTPHPAIDIDPTPPEGSFINDGILSFDQLMLFKTTPSGMRHEKRNAGGCTGFLRLSAARLRMSMEPLFVQGDKIVVYHLLEDLPGHFLAQKRASDQAATLKLLKQEGNERYPFALNPDWPERIVRRTEEWSICRRAR